MKVLGINFGGRVMSVCEITVKHALFAAKEMGADVEFVRTIGKDIRTCTGCGACSRKRDNGENVHCVLKDDYAALEEKYLDADCIIVAAPVFSVGTTGQMKNFIDRFGAAHDRAALDEEQKKRISRQLHELKARLKTDPSVTVVFFQADGRKSGGSYETITGTAKKVDEYLGALEMSNGIVIPFKDIMSLE